VYHLSNSDLSSKNSYIGVAFFWLAPQDLHITLASFDLASADTVSYPHGSGMHGEQLLLKH
jgi:hypothetical protein